MRMLGLLVVLGLLLPTAARAGAVNLRWNACFGDGGVANRLFACDTNAGFEQLVATFILPAPVDGVQGIDAVVQIAFAGASFPAWWEFGVGGNCRPSSLVTSAVPPIGASSCIDFSNGRDAFYTYQPMSSTLVRLEVLSPLIPSTSFDLGAGQEYLAFTARIDHLKTAGTGACGGCLVGACAVLTGLKLIRPSPNTDAFLNPSSSNDVIALWQNGTGIANLNCGIAGRVCCDGIFTPVKRSTWGEVKALYR